MTWLFVFFKTRVLKSILQTDDLKMWQLCYVSRFLTTLMIGRTGFNCKRFQESILAYFDLYGTTSENMDLHKTLSFCHSNLGVFDLQNHNKQFHIVYKINSLWNFTTITYLD